MGANGVHKDRRRVARHRCRLAIEVDAHRGGPCGILHIVAIVQRILIVRNDLGRLDDAANDGTWLIVMCHGITTTGGDIKQSLADQFFAHAGQYVKNGDLWSATFGEATKYVRERQSTTVSERYENNVVYVDMTINRTTADGKPLPESVFNYPLTVEVRVPDDWHTVYYRVNGQNEVTSVYVRDGVAYAMVNLIPGADGAKTATAIRFVN